MVKIGLKILSQGTGGFEEAGGGQQTKIVSFKFGDKFLISSYIDSLVKFSECEKTVELVANISTRAGHT